MPLSAWAVPSPTGTRCGARWAICWRMPTPCLQGIGTRSTGRPSVPFRAYFLEVAKPRQKDETTLFPGTHELLRGLHERGVRLGIVSTKTGETIAHIMDKYGLGNTLELILGSYDVTHHKPHPEGILKALDQMGVAPEEFLYCGDTILDAQAAQGAGVDFAAVLNGTTQAPAFAPYPCVHIAPDLTELAQWLEDRA